MILTPAEQTLILETERAYLTARLTTSTIHAQPARDLNEPSLRFYEGWLIIGWLIESSATGGIISRVVAWCEQDGRIVVAPGKDVAARIAGLTTNAPPK